MRVEVDDKSGFCFGVVNAISKAEECIAEAANLLSPPPANKRLVSLGDIVHNGAEMARLDVLGLEVVPENEPLEHLAGRRVLIRAHGEPPSTYAAARRWGITLVDATCPVVAALQKTARVAYAAMERVDGQVVIFGRRGHAEVRGLVGQGEGLVCVDGDAGEAECADIDSRRAAGVSRFVVVESEADLDGVDFTRQIYFLAQTTSSLDEFNRLGEEIKRRAKITNVTIHDTVCRRVAGHETHLADFARHADIVVFVAGAKSSNGRVLFEAVRAANPRSHKIEYASELRPEWFVPDVGSEDNVGRGCDKAGLREISIGVCGATSTPRWLMNEIAEKIKTL